MQFISKLNYMKYLYYIHSNVQHSMFYVVFTILNK